VLDSCIDGNNCDVIVLFVCFLVKMVHVGFYILGQRVFVH